MQIVKLITGPIAVNTYILYGAANGEAIVIDPGGNVSLIRDMLQKLQVQATHVLLTHGHFDHCGAVKQLQEDGAKVVMHKKDIQILPHNHAAMERFGKKFRMFDPNFTVRDGERIKLAGITLKVIATPGHTAGSITLASDDCLFTGDTLFYLSVGRTDLPTGDEAVLTESVKKLLKMDGKLKVYPGHGMATSIAYERDHNPYV